MMGSRPIEVGIIGLGRAGYDIHIARLRGDDRFRIAAVSDWLPERIDEVSSEFDCKGYADYRDMLSDPNVELVVVASASNTHAAITREVLRSGRHVLCEKPMASTAQSALSMIHAAAKARKKLFIHHQYRFNADATHIMDVIRSKRIGHIFEIRIRVLSFARRNDWQTLRKYNGGLLNNHGTHYLDLGLQMLGAPVKHVACNLQQIASAGDTEDHVKVLLIAENGCTLDFEASAACAYPEPKWTLLGSNGTLVSDGKTSKIKWFDPKKADTLEVVEGAVAGRKYGNDDVLPWQEEEVPSVGPDGGDFYDNVHAVLRERRAMVVKPEEVYEMMKLVEKCRRISGFY